DGLIDTLEEILDGRTGRVRVSDVWKILGIQKKDQDAKATKRVREAMDTLGWKKETQRFAAKPTRCFVKDPNDKTEWVVSGLGDDVHFEVGNPDGRVFQEDMSLS